MSRYYIFLFLFILGFGLGVFFDNQGYMGLVLKEVKEEKILAEVTLGGENNNEIEEVSFKKETLPILSSPSFQDIILNINLAGATINLQTDRVVMEGNEEKKINPVLLNSNSSITCEGSNLVPQRGGIFISEINWMGSEESSDDEWIELKNTSQYEVDVTGWKLLNEDRDLNVVLSGVIKSRDLFLLERGGDETVLGMAADAIYTGALSNQGENIYLFDEHCNLIDEAKSLDGWQGGDKNNYKTMERSFSTLGWQTSINKGGTPGSDNNIVIVKNNSLGALSSVEIKSEVVLEGIVQNNVSNSLYISEIMAGSDLEAKDEFIEIYNPTSETIDLTGWSIKKKSSTGNESSLVASSRLEGLSIKPLSYFLIGNEGGYRGSVVLDANFATSNTLAYSNNGIVVYNQEDIKIYEVSWEEIPKNKSYENINGVWSVREVPDPQNSL